MWINAFDKLTKETDKRKAEILKKQRVLDTTSGAAAENET